MANPFPTSAAGARLFEEIRREIPRLPLVAGPPAVLRAIDEAFRLSDAEIFGAEVADKVMAAAVRAGLLLRADRMDESHALSQGIENPEGSFWHGILHRREPDFSNARYWFRRVGAHPVFAALSRRDGGGPPEGSAFREVTRGGGWDVLRLVDLCEEARRTARQPLAEELESIQDREIDLLLEYCVAGAIGRPSGRATGGNER